MNIKKQFKDGLITNNPVLVQLLGMCSTMAITTMLFLRHRYGRVRSHHPHMLQCSYLRNA